MCARTNRTTCWPAFDLLPIPGCCLQRQPVANGRQYLGDTRGHVDGEERRPCIRLHHQHHPNRIAGRQLSTNVSYRMSVDWPYGPNMPLDDLLRRPTYLARLMRPSP